MPTISKLLWVFFFAFVSWAVYCSRHENLFFTPGALGVVRLFLWALFGLFTGYSIHCSRRENLFKTIRQMTRQYWGRQIGMDLYLGLTLTLFVVYLNEGSLLMVLIWLVPVLIYANQITLLYFALHFDSIVAKLGAGQ